MASDCRETYKYLPIAPECLPFLKQKAQELPGVSIEKMEVFGIGMVALEAMLFNSTRRYYSNLSNNEYALAFDQKLVRKDFKELRDIYPHALTDLLERMVEVEPKGRISLGEAKEYIKSIRESISISGAIKLIEDE
jgi:serine/threonine protein kinase